MRHKRCINVRPQHQIPQQEGRTCRTGCGQPSMRATTGARTFRLRTRSTPHGNGHLRPSRPTFVLARPTACTSHVHEPLRFKDAPAGRGVGHRACGRRRAQRAAPPGVGPARLFQTVTSKVSTGASNFFQSRPRTDAFSKDSGGSLGSRAPAGACGRRRAQRV